MTWRRSKRNGIGPEHEHEKLLKTKYPRLSCDESVDIELHACPYGNHFLELLCFKVPR